MVIIFILHSLRLTRSLHSGGGLGGQLHPISLLLNFGADPTLQDDDGNTPVHLVCLMAMEALLPAEAMGGRGAQDYEALMEIAALLLSNGKPHDSPCP
jgi:hypothetical protein